MAVAFGAAGAVTFSGVNGTSVAPAYPASIAAGNLLTLYIGMKPSTANGGTVTTPAGWTPITSLTGAGGYATTLGADTGNTNIFAYYKVAVGTETGTLSVTIGTNNVAWAQIKRWTNASGVWSVVGSTGSDVAAGSWSITAAAVLNIKAGDFLDLAATIPTDVNGTANMSAHALSASGISAFSAITEDLDSSSGTGNDIGCVSVHASVTTGTTATGAVIWTATAGTTSTNVRGPAAIIRIRELVDVTSGSLILKDTINPGVTYNDVNSTATVVSKSFSPPANALIVVPWSGNDTASGTASTAPTITNSGTALTWTRQTWKSDSTTPAANAQAAVFTATTTTAPGAITVTVTNNTTGATSRQAAVEPIVFTDTSGVAPTVGVIGSSALTTAANVSQSVTPTAAGSWLLLATSAVVTGTHTAGTGMTLLDTGGGTGFSYGYFRRTTADGVSGTAMTLAATVGGTDKAWAYIEVKPAVLPKAKTLVDDFATADSAKWLGYGTNVAINASRLQVTTTTSYSGTASVNRYDLRDSSISIEIVQLPTLGNGSTSATMQAIIDSNNAVAISWEGGNIRGTHIVNGVRSDVSTTYNATAHRIWRIRESGGTTYWEASSTGASWVNLRAPLPTPINASSLQLSLNSGYWGTETTPGSAIFDSFNATYADPPPDPRTIYVDSAGSDSNDGLTTSTPWATVSKVTNTLLYPGDQILFKRGGTWTGNLVIAGSGTSLLPITVTAYGTGSLPIITGGGSSGVAGTLKPCEVYGSWVVLDSVEFRGSIDNDVYINGGDCTIQGCTIRWGSFGIFQAPQGARLKVLSNTVVDVNVGVIGPGTDDDSGAMGIALEGDAPEVAYNTISGSVFTSPDYGLDGSAIEIYGATNAVVHHNRGIDCVGFIELGATTTDNNILHNNLVTSSISNATGFVVHGDLYEDGVTDDPFGPVTNTEIHHNTVVLTGGTSGASVGVWVSPQGEVDLQNNIFVVTSSANMAAIYPTSRTVVEKGNVYWGGAGNNSITMPGGGGSGFIDATSTIANPLFVSSTDFRLQQGSPALDRGADLGYTIDYAGNARISETAPDSGAYEGAVSNSISTLTDAFASQDTAKWTGWSTDVAVVSGQLQIACTSAYPTLNSVNSYDLTGSSVTIEVPQTAGVGTSTDTAVYLDGNSTATGGGRALTMVVENTTLYLRYNTGSGNNDTTVAYNATSMRWWRISESAGAVTWATSPDRSTWTTQRTASPAISFSGFYAHLQSGYWGTETSPRPALFDNFNVIPTVTPFIGWGWGVNV